VDRIVENCAALNRLRACERRSFRRRVYDAVVRTDFQKIDRSIPIVAEAEQMTGYRIYYLHRGAQIVILLCGGDKRTQQQDIKRALKLAETL
jgi:putative addiction module killer protein